MIIDKTKEFYPTIEGSEYLEYLSDDIPAGVTIFKNNVVISMKGNIRISRFDPTWGWRAGNSFHKNFASPEEALKDYLDTFHGQ